MKRIDLIGQNGATADHYIVRYNGTLYKKINNIVHYKHKTGWRQSMRQNWDYFIENGVVDESNYTDN